MSKAEVLCHFRDTISAAGISVTRPDEDGVPCQRFGGHVLRVSGAQYLSRIGLRAAGIQLHGRWASDTINKYLQQAPLANVPQLVTQGVLSGVSNHQEKPEPATVQHLTGLRLPDRF